MIPGKKRPGTQSRESAGRAVRRFAGQVSSPAEGWRTFSADPANDIWCIGRRWRSGRYRPWRIRKSSEPGAKGTLSTWLSRQTGRVIGFRARAGGRGCPAGMDAPDGFPGAVTGRNPVCLMNGWERRRLGKGPPGKQEIAPPSTCCGCHRECGGRRRDSRSRVTSSPRVSGRNFSTWKIKVLALP